MQSTMAAVMDKLAATLELDCAEVSRHYQLANAEVDRLVADTPFYLFRDYFEMIFSNFLGRIDRPHLHSHFAWFEEFHREMLLDCLELKSDCQETLARLKGEGLYLSAVSNIDDNMLEPLIERAQLQRWLDHWTSSEAAQSCKPHRRFFELALEKSGLRSDQVLFVGDSREHDILGAHALGMKTVLISEIGQPVPMHIGRETPEPDFSITSLSELPEIFLSLGARI
ncbi:MAG: HAD family hydrolase [Rhodocyclaceae bacterium]|nr:HAD family hydrolase [Rhodocyclaceae bacterium]